MGSGSGVDHPGLDVGNQTLADRPGVSGVHGIVELDDDAAVLEVDGVGPATQVTVLHTVHDALEGLLPLVDL